MAYRVYLLVLVWLLSVGIVLSFTCKSHLNKDVEWFIEYKLPQTLVNDQNVYNKEGTNVLYLDPASTEWHKLGATFLNSDPVFFTLRQLYEQKKEDTDYMYLMYNDQPPSDAKKNANSEKGHAKGVIGFKIDKGFWMPHTVPTFPRSGRTSSSIISEKRTTNGQIFMCVSMKTADISRISEAFEYTNPFVYNPYIGDSFKNAVPDAAKFDKYTDINNNNAPPSGSNAAPYKGAFTARGGQVFSIFSKSRSLEADIYQRYSKELNEKLYVQTWRPNLASSGGVQNLENIKFVASPGGSVSFKSNSDHSKWLVTQNKAIFCIGDLNRAKSQTRRGGGLLCMGNTNVARLFREAGLEEEKAKECQQSVARRKRVRTLGDNDFAKRPGKQDKTDNGCE